MNPQREGEGLRRKDTVDRTLNQGPSRAPGPEQDRDRRIVSVVYPVQDPGPDLKKGGKMVPENIKRSPPETKWIQDLKTEHKEPDSAQEREGKPKDPPELQTKLHLQAVYPPGKRMTEKRRKTFQKETWRRTNVLN